MKIIKAANIKFPLRAVFIGNVPIKEKARRILARIEGWFGGSKKKSV